ncbi:MAG: hypothetical protein ACR2KG_09435 [Nocardioidaceae bacterium]
MTRGQYYSRVMPSAAIIYVIVLIATHANVTAVVIGALVFGLIAVSAPWFTSADAATGRTRNRHRNRNR